MLRRLWPAREPAAEQIRDTPEFREAFRQAVVRFLQDLVEESVDKNFDVLWPDFVRGQSETYTLPLTLTLVKADARFMAYLHDASRRIREIPDLRTITDMPR